MTHPDPLMHLRQTLTLAGVPEDVDPRRSLGTLAYQSTFKASEPSAGESDPAGLEQPTPTLDSLPPLMIHEAGSLDTTSAHRFEVLRTIGQGGMGRVELARQPGLAREVAVKRLRAGRGTPQASRALIREARLMGGLEHPNIPPIYMLGRSEDEPVLAMKRIEGTTWAGALDDPEDPGWAERGGDHLEGNLEVLMQVCQAVHFAHSRQTLHLDIKPENVMLGRFGEVYLIDWGIARRLEEEVDAEAPVLVGTPAYMAPEMTEGLRCTSQATDVYLLGATLHLVITGSPRHRGSTLLETMMDALRSSPHDYPESVHPELASIANRACHVDPAQRFDSAQELRSALSDYLRLRSSLALSDAAHQRLALLERLADERPPTQGPSQALRNAFSECRFGFEQALGKAAHNERARSGRLRAYTVMIDAELDARNAGAAEVLMAALDDPLPERRARLERLREALVRDAEAQARLQQMERELSARDGSWTRMVSVVFHSLLILVVMGGVGLVDRMGWLEISATHNLMVAVFILALSIISIFAQPQKFLHNRVIRQTSTIVVLGGLVLVTGRIAALVLGLPLSQTAILDMLALAMLMGCVEVVIGKLLAGVLIAVALVAVVIVASLAPLYAYEVGGVFCAALNAKFAWDFRPLLEEASDHKSSDELASGSESTRTGSGR